MGVLDDAVEVIDMLESNAFPRLSFFLDEFFVQEKLFFTKIRQVLEFILANASEPFDVIDEALDELDNLQTSNMITSFMSHCFI
eukprot:m.1388 g.1388  ORF g.1388 m.1388 type:complete len:84 (+) comp824_c0_seq1:672-923(+)